MNKVSVAFIGMGYRGKQLFRLLRNIPFFQILAVADPGVNCLIFLAIIMERIPVLKC